MKTREQVGPGEQVLTILAKDFLAVAVFA